MRVIILHPRLFQSGFGTERETCTYCCDGVNSKGLKQGYRCSFYYKVLLNVLWACPQRSRGVAEKVALSRESNPIYRNPGGCSTIELTPAIQPPHRTCWCLRHQQLLKFILDWLNISQERQDSHCELVKMIANAKLSYTIEYEFFHTSDIIGKCHDCLKSLLKMVSINFYNLKIQESSQNKKGLVYIVGGGYGGKNSVEIFDCNEKSWCKGKDMNKGRSAHECLVINNKIYAIGGRYGNNSIEEFSLVKQKWAEFDNLNEEKR